MKNNFEQNKGISMESIYNFSSSSSTVNEDETINKENAMIILPKVVELIFDRLINNQSNLTVKLSSKLKFSLKPSIYFTYFQHLLVTRKKYKLNEYVKKSKLSSILRSNRTSVKNFFTARTRFLKFFNATDNKHLVAIGELLKKTIYISEKNKKKLIGFNEISGTRIISRVGNA
ncbi:MAG: hypothetical protein KF721_12515 [Ignavibacteriaceae bacterium]|nr:hypothetical protein [Ignavibacteriaceae bacterium]